MTGEIELVSVWSGSSWREVPPPQVEVPKAPLRTAVIRDLLRERKWTARELAEELGMLPSSVQRVIRDLRQTDVVHEAPLQITRRRNQRGRNQKVYWVGAC